MAISCNWWSEEMDICFSFLNSCENVIFEQFSTAAIHFCNKKNRIHIHHLAHLEAPELHFEFQAPLTYEIAKTFSKKVRSTLPTTWSRATRSRSLGRGSRKQRGLLGRERRNSQ